MWSEIIEVFSAVLVSMGGIELVKWLFLRKQSTRKASAEADKEETAAKQDEMQRFKDMILFLEAQMGELQERIKREQEERAADNEKRREIQAKYDELKRKYDELVNAG